MSRESKRQCRFCVYFEEEYDIELIFYGCTKRYFPHAEDYLDLAPTCGDYTLDDRPGSRWSKLSQDYQDSLR